MEAAAREAKWTSKAEYLTEFAAQIHIAFSLICIQLSTEFQLEPHNLVIEVRRTGGLR